MRKFPKIVRISRDLLVRGESRNENLREISRIIIGSRDI
jgi:hypothetical protein